MKCAPDITSSLSSHCLCPHLEAQPLIPLVRSNVMYMQIVP